MYEMTCKVTRCGDVWEVIQYEIPVPVGFKVSRKHPDLIEDREDREVERRMDNLARARKSVRQIVLTNQTEYTKFFTLTYANTQLDYDSVTHDFKMFIKNLKRKGFDNLPYLYVIEHQKERGKKEGNEGSLHIHCLIFTDKYIPYSIVKHCWGKRGSVDVQAIKDIRNLGAYVCKYITKDGYVGSNKKMFHTSRGLKRPESKCMYADGGHDHGLEAFSTVGDVLSGLDVYYQNETMFTYEVDGEEVTQRVKYFQGRRKRCSK